jgi:hypothetical protein
VEVTAAALQDGHRDREREPRDGREQEETDERPREQEVARDVPAPEPHRPTAEVGEVFVPAVREVERDHPDEVDGRLRPDREPNTRGGEAGEQERQLGQRRPREGEGGRFGVDGTPEACDAYRPGVVLRTRWGDTRTVVGLLPRLSCPSLRPVCGRHAGAAIATGRG